MSTIRLNSPGIYFKILCVGSISAVSRPGHSGLIIPNSAYSWKHHIPHLRKKMFFKVESNENKLRKLMSFCHFSQNFTEELMNGRSQEEPLWLDILPYLTRSPVRRAAAPPPPPPTLTPVHPQPPPPHLPYSPYASLCIKVGMTLCKHGWGKCKVKRYPATERHDLL